MKKQRVFSEYDEFYSALENGDYNQFRLLLGLRRTRDPKLEDCANQSIVQRNSWAAAAYIDFVLSHPAFWIIKDDFDFDSLICDFLSNISDFNFSYDVANKIKSSDRTKEGIAIYFQHLFFTRPVMIFWVYSVFNSNPKHSPRPGFFERKWLNWNPSSEQNARSLSFAFDRHLVALLSCLRHLCKDLRRLISQHYAQVWWNQFPDQAAARKLVINLT